MDITSTNDIDLLYSIIVHSIINATEQCIPKAKFKPYIKPYWNEELATLHKEMSILRQNWINNNRPRDNNNNSYK